MKTFRALCASALLLFLSHSAYRACAQLPQAVTFPEIYGPYSGVFLSDGPGLTKPLLEHDPLLEATSPFSLSLWVKGEGESKGEATESTLLGGVGDPADEYSRYLALDHGRLTLWMGEGNAITAPQPLTGDTWHFVAATSDGILAHLYADGREVASGHLVLGAVANVLQLAPTMPPRHAGAHFSGKIAALTVEHRALTSQAVQALATNASLPLRSNFEESAKSWPVQDRGQAGLSAPQDPQTLPRGLADFSPPSSKPVASGPSLTSLEKNHWVIANGWRLAEAPRVSADPLSMAQPGFDVKSWMQATVPGTVLTTMVDRGVYPDPDFGMNNMAIPESLNQQDYWYRNEFTGPAAINGQAVTLTFNGINYAAEVYCNGKRLGAIKGAFIRGAFDVTGILKAGQPNALLVRISPPPHPGIPHEQSLKAGPGPNGGLMAIDGPTFIATEGWDWVPGIRDRDTGIWQDVTLTATGKVSIGDAQIITTLPLPDTSRAEVRISVPLHNASGTPVDGELRASFDDIKINKAVTLASGDTTVSLTPADFPQLTITHPRLWWPNGYGKQELHQLNLTFQQANRESDSKQIKFGIREVTYELGLLDSTGHMRRVEISPTQARLRGEKLVDVSHQGMRKLKDGWVASLLPGAEHSSAVHSLTDAKMESYLVIKVNGVRIAAKGGSWGMDDARKRVSREHLEPFFRLHKNANLTIIRNWVGQSTEEVFYELADEYGLMVWNDFWDSTQNSNLEAEDPALFLANAQDTVLRFRNHPSIVLWCGRNEGVPQPALNAGLNNLLYSLDGTRYYSPDSNRVNLQDSGPYGYRPPEQYFTTLSHGFAVEVGTLSPSTKEAIQASMAAPDRWPIGDVWAYHDFHSQGSGRTAPFMTEIEKEFGAATSLEDFDRKAQMLNYVNHRAIFEGFAANLFAPNSGRMLWMTQPAWPSNNWQIFSSDYDTQGSFYGVMKAAEPIHVQMNLPSYDIAVINNTATDLPALSVHARAYSLDNRLLLEQTAAVTARAASSTVAFAWELEKHLRQELALVKLELRNAAGAMISTNFYWQGTTPESYRKLNSLPKVLVSATAEAERKGDEVHVQVHLKNAGSAAVLAAKMTLENAADGSRILPAYLDANYISLLPGESQEVEIIYPDAAARGNAKVAFRGWNLLPLTIPVTRKAAN